MNVIKMIVVCAMVGLGATALEARPPRGNPGGGRPSRPAGVRMAPGNVEPRRSMPSGSAVRPSGASVRPSGMTRPPAGNAVRPATRIARPPAPTVNRSRPPNAGRSPHLGRFHGRGLHHAPPPPHYHSWRRGAIHPIYRNCWFDDVWYDEVGYAYYSPEVVVDTSPTIVSAPPPVSLAGWTNIGQHPYLRNCWDSNGIWYDGAGMMWQPPTAVVLPPTPVVAPAPVVAPPETVVAPAAPVVAAPTTTVEY